MATRKSNTKKTTTKSTEGGAAGKNKAGTPMKKRPSRPTVKRPTKGKAEKSTPKMIVKPKVGKTAGITKPGKDLKETVAQLAKAEAQTVKLLAQLSKEKEKAVAKRAKSPERGLEAILGGTLVWNDKSKKAADQDWRRAFHGFVVVINNYHFKKEEIVLNDPPMQSLVLCAIPRDTDHGGNGTLERSQNRLAIHHCLTSNEVFTGTPAYISEEEFDAVWAEDQDIGGPMRSIEDASVEFVVV